MTATAWTPSSWRTRPAGQQPQWPDEGRLDDVLKRLATLPPLVFAGEARRLTAAPHVARDLPLAKQLVVGAQLRANEGIEHLNECARPPRFCLESLRRARAKARVLPPMGRRELGRMRHCADV